MSIVWPKIVLFGDSQVQRAFDPSSSPWGALLATKFQRVADVITRGFSGYTSRSGRIILPHIFNRENISDVEAFVIFFGSNDSSGKLDASPYYVPIEEYSENLEEMIKYLQDWPRFLIDGLHISPDGAELTYELLWPILKKKIDPSEMLLPYWRDINHIKAEDNEDDICFKKCPNLRV
ncbi:unnamed protein product [Larinioides sclopetarius]|uniref:SGNH hydrolase-type esterase domain-containing protein n=1 Tax=Larinioides sclopetarius TaxID=280406 RepID=A0AAV2A2P8_9ARAC